MTHQVAKAVDIPVMGMGGISTWQDAVEFLIKYLDSQGLDSVEDIIGIV